LNDPNPIFCVLKNNLIFWISNINFKRKAKKKKKSHQVGNLRAKEIKNFLMLLFFLKKTKENKNV